MFPLVREAISAVIPVETLRHVGFSHFEADECGALNTFLAIAPEAAPLSSDLGAMVSVNDFSDRPGRGLADGEQFSTGSHRLEWIYTPHVPHGWDCGVLFDHTTRTLFCGDLFTQGGSKCPAVTEDDVVEPSERFRGPLDYFAHAKGTGAILERLALLNPNMLACMHGSAFRGDAAAQLRKLCAAISA
jgi:flavorubredoxin